MGLTPTTDPSKYPSPSGAATEIPDYSVFGAGHPLVQQLGMALTTLGDITRSPAERNQIRMQRLQEIKDQQEAEYQSGELANQRTQQAETARHNQVDEANTAANNASQDRYRTGEINNQANENQEKQDETLDAPAVLKALGLDDLAAQSQGRKIPASSVATLLKPPTEKNNIVRSIHDPASGKDFDTMFGPNGDFVKVLGESKPAGANIELTPEGLAFQTSMVKNTGKTTLQGMGVGKASVQVANELGKEGVPATEVAQNMAKYNYGKNATVQQQMVTAQHVLDMVKVTGAVFDQMARGNTKGINWASNAIKNAFGDEAPTDAKTAQFLLGGEAIKYVTLNGGSQAEEQAARTLIDTSASPAQTRGALRVIETFVNGRLALQKKQSGAAAVDLGGAAGTRSGPDPNQKAGYVRVKSKSGVIGQFDGTPEEARQAGYEPIQ